MADVSALGKLIRERREELGLSQRALAECVGLNHSIVHKVETGVREVSENRLVAIASILGLDAGEVLILSQVDNSTGLAKRKWERVLTDYKAGREDAAIVEIDADDVGFSSEQQRWIFRVPEYRQAA